MATYSNYSGEDPYANAPLPPQKSKLKRTIIIAVVLIVLVLGGMFGFRMFMMAKMGGGGGFGGSFPTAVTALPPRAEKADRVITAVGTMRADQSIKAAAEIAGRIAEIPGIEGTAVKKGDILVQLDQQTTQAEYDDADANADLTAANYGRARQLAAQKVGTERSKDEAQAAMKQAEARLALAKAQLDKTTIRAPFDGVLGLREKSVGAYVQPGEAILSLTSVDPVYIDFRVPELKSDGVKLGQKVSVEVDALSGKIFLGEVTATDAVLDEAGRSLNVRAKLSNKDGDLRPGMYGRVSLAYGQPQDVLIVPERAVFLQADGAYVFRAVDAKAVLTKVELGERRVGEVEIVKGISAQDDVITDGQIKLRPDAKVMILNKPNTPEGQAGQNQPEAAPQKEPAPAEKK